MDSIVEEVPGRPEADHFVFALGRPLSPRPTKAQLLRPTPSPLLPPVSTESVLPYSASENGARGRPISPSTTASPGRRYRTVEERWAAYERGLASKPLPRPPADSARRMKRLSLDSLKRSAAIKGKVTNPSLQEDEHGRPAGQRGVSMSGAGGWRSAESLHATHGWGRAGPSSSSLTLTVGLSTGEANASSPSLPIPVADHRSRPMSPAELELFPQSVGPAPSASSHSGSIPSGSRIAPPPSDTSSAHRRVSFDPPNSPPYAAGLGSPRPSDQETASTSPVPQGAGAATFGVRTHSSHRSIRSTGTVSSQTSLYSDVSPSVNRPFAVPVPNRQTSLLPDAVIFSTTPAGSAETGEPSTASRLPEQREPGDRYLRSQPGVVGLGEGWAGGPQLKNKKRYRWSMRKHQPEEQDPLALWAIAETQEVPGPSRSPLKEMWNRSRNVLSSNTNRSSSTMVGDHAPPQNGMGRIKGFFSRSRLNLSDAPLDRTVAQEDDRGTEKKQRNRRSVADFFTFSRSTYNLQLGSKSTNNLSGDALSRPSETTGAPQTPRTTPMMLDRSASPARDYFIDSPVSRSKREAMYSRPPTAASMASLDTPVESTEDFAQRYRLSRLPLSGTQSAVRIAENHPAGGSGLASASVDRLGSADPTPDPIIVRDSGRAPGAMGGFGSSPHDQVPGLDTLASWVGDGRDAPRPFGSAINDRAARRSLMAESGDGTASRLNSLRSRFGTSAQSWRNKSQLTSRSEMDLPYSASREQDGDHMVWGRSYRALSALDKLRSATASPTAESINVSMARYEGARLDPALPPATAQPTFMPLAAPVAPRSSRISPRDVKQSRRRSWFASTDNLSRRLSSLLDEPQKETSLAPANDFAPRSTPARPTLLAKLRSTSQSASRRSSYILSSYTSRKTDDRPLAAASTPALSLAAYNDHAYVLSHLGMSGDSLGLDDILHPAQQQGAMVQLDEAAQVFRLPPTSIPEEPILLPRPGERVRRSEVDGRERRAKRRAQVFDEGQWGAGDGPGALQDGAVPMYGASSAHAESSGTEVADEAGEQPRDVAYSSTPNLADHSRTDTIGTTSSMSMTDSPDPVTPRSAHSGLSALLPPPVPPKTPFDLPAAYDPALLVVPSAGVRPGLSDRASVAESFYTAVSGTTTPPGLGSRRDSFVSAQTQDQFYDPEDGVSTPSAQVRDNGYGLGALGLTPTAEPMPLPPPLPLPLEPGGKQRHRLSWLSITSDRTARTGLSIGSADDAAGQGVLQEARPVHVGEMIQDQGRRPSLVDVDDLRTVAALVHT